jgi:hypothetical protein
MPEPPVQSDMRSQGLPPQPPGEPPWFPQGSPAVLLVTSPAQLPAALSQHEKPVVIENTRANAWLIYWLKWLLRWKDILIIGWLLLQSFTLGYNLQYDWHIKWKGIEVGGKITLTPKLPAGEE